VSLISTECAWVPRGWLQWTPRLAEALYYECVPVRLSPCMLISSLIYYECVPVRLSPCMLPGLLILNAC
jgi:hypothetical protein